MISGDLAEQGVVDVTDIDPDGFSLLLRYLYSGCTRMNSVLDALHTRAAARKWLIMYLVEGCTDYIQEHLSPANLCSCLDYYAVTGELNMDKFVPNIMQFWPVLTPTQVLWLKDFEQAEPYAIDYILENVRYVLEIALAEIAVRWAQEECVRSRDTGSPLQLKVAVIPFFPKLRLLNMTAEEFIRGQVMWGIMNDDEALCVLPLPLPPGFLRAGQVTEATHS
ncbi:BTB/POZ domain-containing protein 6-like [Amblyomma americanum]